MKTFLLLGVIGLVAADSPENAPAQATAKCTYVTDNTPSHGQRYNYTILVQPNSGYHNSWCADVKRTVTKCIAKGEVADVSDKVLVVHNCTVPVFDNTEPGYPWLSANISLSHRSGASERCVTEAIDDSLKGSEVDWLGRFGCESKYRIPGDVPKKAFGTTTPTATQPAKLSASCTTTGLVKTFTA